MNLLIIDKDGCIVSLDYFKTLKVNLLHFFNNYSTVGNLSKIWITKKKHVL